MTLAETRAAEAESTARIEAIERSRMARLVDEFPGLTIPEIARKLQRHGEFLLVDPWYRRADQLVEDGGIERVGTGSAAKHYTIGRAPCATTTTAPDAAPPRISAPAATTPTTTAPTTTAAPAGVLAAAPSATASPTVGDVRTRPGPAEARDADGADSKPPEPYSANDAPEIASPRSSPPVLPIPTTSPSDSEPDVTQSDAILALLREHPGLLSSEIGARLSLTQASTTLSRLAARGIVRGPGRALRTKAPVDAMAISASRTARSDSAQSAASVVLEAQHSPVSLDARSDTAFHTARCVAVNVDVRTATIAW